MKEEMWHQATRHDKTHIRDEDERFQAEKSVPYRASSKNHSTAAPRGFDPV